MYTDCSQRHFLYTMASHFGAIFLWWSSGSTSWAWRGCLPQDLPALLDHLGIVSLSDEETQVAKKRKAYSIIDIVCFFAF